MPERRRSVRYPVDDVNGQLHVTSTARLRTLAQSEAVLETAHQVRILRPYTLAFGLGDDTTLKVQGTVTTCRLSSLRSAGGESVPSYETVVRFTAPLPSAMQRLLGPRRGADEAVALDALAAAGLQPTVHLDTSQTFAVRNISLNGALIETERPLAAGARLETEIRPGATTVATQARIVFSRQVEADGRVVFQLGIEFLATPERDLRALEELLASQPAPPA